MTISRRKYLAQLTSASEAMTKIVGIEISQHHYNDFFAEDINGADATAIAAHIQVIAKTLDLILLKNDAETDVCFVDAANDAAGALIRAGEAEDERRENPPETRR